MSDEAVTQKQLSGCKIGIQRRGTVVYLSLESTSEYVAIELFERLVKGAKSGTLKLDLAIR